jgi:predicted transcriptional regulator
VPTLGDFEIQVLEYVWERETVDVNQTHDAVGEARGVTHNTTQSTLKRLWQKGLLERRKEGRAFVYKPAVSRQELTEQMVGDVVDRVASDDMDVAMQAFIGFADEAGEETLDRLQSLIDERREALRDSEDSGQGGQT